MYPTDVRGGAEATILGFAEEKELYGHGDIVFVGLGTRHGLSVGDELEVRAAGSEGAWSVDSEGTLQVVKVDEGMASARIIGLSGPVVTEGAHVRLVRAMPGQRR